MDQLICLQIMIASNINLLLCIRRYLVLTSFPSMSSTARETRELRETFLNLTRPLLAEAPPFTRAASRKSTTNARARRLANPFPTPISFSFFWFHSLCVLLFCCLLASESRAVVVVQQRRYILDRQAKIFF